MAWPIKRDPPRLRFWLGLCAVCALLIDLGSLHRLHHGDSLLPILMSLMRWSPFFWEQDRFGMIVPLIAMPLANPLANLLFQDFLDILLGLFAFFLLARFLLKDATYPAAAVLALASFLTLCPEDYRFSYLVDACYGTWLVPGVGGLILLERDQGKPPKRRVLGLFLIAVAHWASIATAMYLAPLVVGMMVMRKSSIREGVERLVALAFGVGVGLGMMRLSPYRATAFSTLPASRWVWSYTQLLGTTWLDLAPWGHLVLMVVAAGAGVFVCRRMRLPVDASMRAALVTVLTALAVSMFLGTRSWAAVNGFPSRYLSPLVIFLSVGVAGLAVAPFRAWTNRTLLNLMLCGSMIAASIVGYGLPSISRVRRDLDETLGSRTADLIESRCTHVTGYYNNVWPSVFHARLVLFERGDRRMIWGITHRCDPTRDLWIPVPLPEVFIGLPQGDPEGERWLRVYDLPPLVELEPCKTLRILRPKSEAAKPAASPRILQN